MRTLKQGHGFCLRYRKIFSVHLRECYVFHIVIFFSLRLDCAHQSQDVLEVNITFKESYMHNSPYSYNCQQYLTIKINKEKKKKKDLHCSRKQNDPVLLHREPKWLTANTGADVLGFDLFL